MLITWKESNYLYAINSWIVQIFNHLTIDVLVNSKILKEKKKKGTGNLLF
jgi:hypothetical protein